MPQEGNEWVLSREMLEALGKSSFFIQKLLDVPELPPMEFTIGLLIGIAGHFIEKASEGFTEGTLINPETEQELVFPLKDIVTTVFDRSIIEEKLAKIKQAVS